MKDDKDYEVKPCPFCGGYPTLEVKWDGEKSMTFMFAKCKKCGASSKAYANNRKIESRDDIYLNKSLLETAMMAIEAWDWRAKE